MDEAVEDQERRHEEEAEETAVPFLKKPTKRQPPPVPRDAKFISIRQVRERYGGTSQMWIERKLKRDPNFPRPFFFGKLRFWRIEELEKFERESVVKRSAAANVPAQGEGDE